MVSKIQKRFKIKFGRRNVKIFLFFLLFSTVIWILVQFSKTYSKVVEVPLKYINEPLDKIVLEENPKHLDIRMTDNGFGILYYKVFTPTFEVDLEKTTQEENQLVYSLEENRTEVREQLGINYNKSEVLHDFIAINYYQKMVKTVPIVSRIQVNFAAGYSSPDNIQLQPDSLLISGHSQVVDTTESVETVPLELKEISSSTSGTVAINKNNLEGISLERDRVAYFLEVEKFTEGRLAIPIEVLNVPRDVEISIFPQEVIVIYQVNLDDYNKVNTTDFRVTCDFNEINPEKDFLIPKIASKPEIVKNTRLNEKKVEFVIKR